MILASRQTKRMISSLCCPGKLRFRYGYWKFEVLNIFMRSIIPQRQVTRNNYQVLIKVPSLNKQTNFWKNARWRRRELVDYLQVKCRKMYCHKQVIFEHEYHILGGEA